MNATIHQPYFLPWLGYFSKLAFSDVFVVLDNVHFRKRHFLDRTKIVNMQGEIRWLSLPTGQHFQENYREVTIAQTDKDYVDKLLKTIEYSYAKTRYFDSEWPEIHNLLISALSNSNLIDINMEIIKDLMIYLNIKLPTIYYASQVSSFCEDATEKILIICKAIGINTIVVGTGKSLQVHDWHKITSSGVEIREQDYLNNHPIYYQSRRKVSGFQKGLNILDSVFNAGKHNTREFITNIQHLPKPLDSSLFTL
ncbi:MAG: WbqC family protein [Ruminiclostridium sp.]|nr:WbqC family protein [Ruminiclostridium sp.]